MGVGMCCFYRGGALGVVMMLLLVDDWIVLFVIALWDCLLYCVLLCYGNLN